MIHSAGLQKGERRTEQTDRTIHEQTDGRTMSVHYRSSGKMKVLLLISLKACIILEKWFLWNHNFHLPLSFQGIESRLSEAKLWLTDFTIAPTMTSQVYFFLLLPRWISSSQKPEKWRKYVNVKLVPFYLHLHSCFGSGQRGWWC